ncbi:MAG: LysR family transcriptional regulator [Ideonella sp. MAG2]|nr:MAG: LysR family transcriptional regulator [Ideonella sp. MAG2]
MKLTHRQIELFRAVMVAGHVTRAAEALHTSQPTVSRELARLEQVLGFGLFERIKGRLHPTPRAMALLAEVEQSFVGLDRIADAALALRDFAQGRLHLACFPALAQALLPEVLARYAERWPQASVSLSALESPALERALTEQAFDLGLSERPEAPPGCERLPFLAAHEVCVLPPGHALAAKPVLEPQDFAHQPFISLAPSDPYRQQIDAVFTQAGVQRQLRLETPSAASVCALVQAGVGVGLVNPVTAQAWQQQGGLEIRPFSVPIAFEVGLVLPQWRAEHPLRADFLSALNALVCKVLQA